MNGMRISLVLAAGVLLAGCFFCQAEEGAAGGDGTTTGGAEKGGKDGKAGRGDRGGESKELKDQMRKILDSTKEERKAFVKSQRDKALEVYKTLAGKDGDAVSAALVTLYTDLCNNAKEYAEKEKTSLTTAINALTIPDEIKTKGVARATERCDADLKNLEERQQERLAFAKSLSGLSAEEVQTAVSKRRDEIRSKMEKKMEEMKKTMEEKGGAGAEGAKTEGGPGAGPAGEGGAAGGDKPAPRPAGRPGPRGGDELLGMEYMGAPGADGPKGEKGDKVGKKPNSKKTDGTMQDQ